MSKINSFECRMLHIMSQRTTYETTCDFCNKSFIPGVGGYDINKDKYEIYCLDCKLDREAKVIDCDNNLSHLWELNYGISNVVSELLNWNHGSGEEFRHWLQVNGLSAEQALLVIDLLATTNKSVAATKT